MHTFNIAIDTHYRSKVWGQYDFFYFFYFIYNIFDQVKADSENLRKNSYLPQTLLLFFLLLLFLFCFLVLD